MRAAWSLPNRLPAIPLPAAVVLGCWLLQQCPEVPGRGWQLLILAFAAIAGIALRRRSAARFAALVLIAFGWAALVADRSLSDRISAESEGQDFTVVGYVDELPLESAHGSRFGFFVLACDQSTPDCPSGRRVRLGWSRSFSRSQDLDDEATQAIAVRPGEIWQLHIRLKRTFAPFNPGLFDAELRLLEEGIAANGYVRKARGTEAPNQRLEGWHLNLRTAFEAARTRGLDALSNALAGVRPDAAGVLLALSFGDQAAIAASDWDVFNRTGVGHLMSISGLHITMLAAIAGSLAGAILRLRWFASSGLLDRIPAVRLRWMLALTVAFSYSGLAGWGIPAQRTCWMLAVTGWALSSGRSRSVLRVLCLAAAVVCALDPWAPLAAGFWLSFAAVAAIVLHASAVQRAHGAPRTSRPARALIEAARTQWAATLSLLPLGALFFSTMSLISPLANAWAVPLVSAFVTPAVLLLAALALVAPGLASLLAPLAGYPVAWMLDALRAMASWPGGQIVLAQPDALSLLLAVVAVALLLAPRPVPGRILCALGLLPLLARGPAPAPADGFRLTALDIGQGMAVLVEAGGKRLLYDTGPAWDAGVDAGSRLIIPWLRTQGIGSLDALVISHADIDHSGGAASVLKLAGAKRVFSSIPAGHRLLAGVGAHERCRRGDAWQWGNVSFEFLHPGDELPPGAARSPTNALSCVLRIASPAGSALLAGDIESRQELDLVERLGSRLRSTLLLVPHHGSNTSSSPRFIDTVAPEFALFQAGYRNRFRHPTARVLARYESAGVRVLRTDHHGAIRVEFTDPGKQPDVRLTRVEDRRYWRMRVPIESQAGPASR